MSGKLDIQGLIRLVITLAAIVGGYYYAMGRIDAHIASADIHKSSAELSEMFVLRREWNYSNSRVEADLNYLRGKVDAIYEKIK
ncbi:MAG: hypothetical protein IKO42_02855 [Opitutales bacterium]|nr:hypothetical protein [Opitutales bacterium]